MPRKVTAILYADVAGYSGLAGEDEDAIHRRLIEYFNLIYATVGDHCDESVTAALSNIADVRSPSDLLISGIFK